MNISEISLSIAIKFYLKHQWGGCIRFLCRSGQNYGFHGHKYLTLGYNWGKGVFSTVFDKILFILASDDYIHKSLHEIEIRPDPITNYIVSGP